MSGHIATWRAGWIWPRRLRWVGLALCGLMGHPGLDPKAQDILAPGRHVFACPRCRRVLYSLTLYSQTGDDNQTIYEGLHD